MKIREVCRGLWTLYAICTDRGDCPLLEFLYEGSAMTAQGLHPRDALAGQKVRMLARLSSIAENGPPRNAEICHQIEKDIWQVELGRIRILWFYDADRMILLAHSFMKSSQKTPEREKRIAREALRRYREAKSRGQLQYLKDGRR